MVLLEIKLIGKKSVGHAFNEVIDDRVRYFFLERMNLKIEAMTKSSCN